MAKPVVTRLPGESHAQLWAHFLRFGFYDGQPVDYAGSRFGRWVVVGIEGWGGSSRWLLRCDCGTEKVMRIINVLKGVSTSCGCYNAELRTRHGMSRSRPYKIWAQMRNRCGNPSNDNFPNYGGRGIAVCERWEVFENFWADMREGYAPKLTLERRDVNGNYEPSNCCWIPRPDQLQNQRRTIWVETPGGRMTLSQAARAFGIKRDTLRRRVRDGWPPERLLSGYCDGASHRG